MASHHAKPDKNMGTSNASPPSGRPASRDTYNADTHRADTTALGYDTQWLCLRACDAGACHRRDRIFILYLDNFCRWMPDSGRFRATGLLGSPWVPGRVGGILDGGGRHVAGGGLQFGGSVMGERIAVAEARDRGVKVGQQAKRGGCLGAVDVEDAADDRAVAAACRGVSVNSTWWRGR